MELFLQMLELQVQLLLLMVVGIVVKKKRVVTHEQQMGVSSLLINLVLPANIIASFLSDIAVSRELIFNCMQAILISLSIQGCAYLLSPVIFRRFDRRINHVMTYGMIVSNSSFIGIPVVEVIFGAMGTLYTSVFQIPIRITMWTAGLSLFTEAVNPREKIKKMLTHPCIVAVAAGFFILLLQIRLPGAVVNMISSLGRCTTALSMLVIGMILADINVKHLFGGSTLYFTLFRLILYPLAVLAILSRLPVNPMIRSISVIMTAMPAGSTTAILAQQYAYDSEYAAKIILISTVCSIVTIPVICLFL